jgi:ubiquinol-cytochrome c reductase cytochrome b subunit
VVLTLQAWYQDRADPVYGRAVSRARVESDRVQALAAGLQGIPPEGVIALARRDPFLQGPRLFAVHCAGCHRYDGHDGLGVGNSDLPTASDLRGFASRAWLMGLLDPGRVDSLDYFGATKFREGKMVRFVKRDVAGFEPAQKEQLHKVLTALAAEAGLPSHAELDQRDAAILEEGRRLIDHEDMRCTECHRFRGLGEDPAGPELTGYGSREWLIEFIRDPAHERFYGQRNDRMPRFGAEQILDDASIGLIADWLRGDGRDP